MGNLGIIITLFSVFYLSLFHTVIPYPTKDEYSEKCPPIPCGVFGNISFPFSNSRRPRMWPFCSEGLSSEQPKMKLRDEPNKWYQIDKISRTDGFWYNITITDIILQNYLSRRNCESFRSSSLGLLKLYDYEIIPKPIILFKCNTPPAGIDFELNYTCSSDDNFHIYYTKDLPPYPPPNCSKVELPVKRNVYNTSHNLFELVSPTLSLQQIKPDLFCHLCQLKRLNCRPNYIGQPQCFDQNIMEIEMNPQKKNKGSIRIGQPKFLLVVTGIVGVLFTCGFICLFMRTRLLTLSFQRKNQDFEAFLESHGPLVVKRYNYSQVKKMTNSFKEKLGQGGYGSVYKGKLLDNRLVAVKMLKVSKEELGEDFINEVAAISRTSHVNIVTLLGFCLEGKKRALVYEFMSNGSLDKFICHKTTLNNDQLLGLEVVEQIAIGIAQGLEYLHRGCNTRIVHFDIKPHNILLDENFCPKIPDFGLAKLCTKKESIVSMLEARGTIGYIAPEVFSRYFGQVSFKSDVYSYGMMILEILGVRKKDEHIIGSNSSEMYFPSWIYKSLENGKDAISEDDKEGEIVRKLKLVGLGCIQGNPSDRPSMSKVIEMLRGSTQTINIPPKPFLPSSSLPPIPLSSYSSTT